MNGNVVAQLWVPGKPEPQGSVRAFVPQKGGQPMRRGDGSIIVNLTSDNPALKAWRAAIRGECLAGRVMPVHGAALEVEATFYLERPKAHYGTGRNEGVLKDSAPAYPAVRPDVDKLLRALLDALTEMAYDDDAQVARVTAVKRYVRAYGDDPGVEVRVLVCEAQTALEISPQMALA